MYPMENLGTPGGLSLPVDIGSANANEMIESPTQNPKARRLITVFDLFIKCSPDRQNRGELLNRPRDKARAGPTRFPDHLTSGQVCKLWFWLANEIAEPPRTLLNCFGRLLDSGG